MTSQLPVFPRFPLSPRPMRNAPKPNWVWGGIRNYRNRGDRGEWEEIWKRLGKVGANRVRVPSVLPLFPLLSICPALPTAPHNPFPANNWVWGGIRNYRTLEAGKSGRIRKIFGRDWGEWTYIGLGFQSLPTLPKTQRPTGFGVGYETTEAGKGGKSGKRCGRDWEWWT